MPSRKIRSRKTSNSARASEGAGARGMNSDIPDGNGKDAQFMGLIHQVLRQDAGPIAHNAFTGF